MFDWTTAINDIYWYFATISFIFGAAIGSFLNVVIYRLPVEDKSIVKPRSFCPSCKTPIAAYDNIPLISYVLLRAKCRHCNKKIGFRYFLIELMTAGFALAFFHMAFGLHKFPPHVALIYFLFTCAMIVITFIDIDLKIIPNQISLPGIPLGLAFSFLMPPPDNTLFSSFAPLPQTFVSSLVGMVIGGGVLWGVGAGYFLLTKKEGMGFGDVKLMAMVGAFLGWLSVPFTLLCGSFFGLVYAIPFVVLPKKGRYHQIPFGPFLAAGAVLYIFFGPELINAYLDLFRG